LAAPKALQLAIHHWQAAPYPHGSDFGTASQQEIKFKLEFPFITTKVRQFCVV